jgi:hypothetical protein
VIAAFDHVERGSVAQPLAHRAEQVEMGQLVAGTLEEQHR